MIEFVEMNVRGAWVVYGTIGIRQFYGYTKSEAIALYLSECKREVFVNEN